MERNNKIRLNAYVVSDIKKYIDEQCELFGISQGAFISIVVNEYKKQKEAIDSMTFIYNKLLQEEHNPGSNN